MMQRWGLASGKKWRRGVQTCSKVAMLTSLGVELFYTIYTIHTMSYTMRCLVVGKLLTWFCVAFVWLPPCIYIVLRRSVSSRGASIGRAASRVVFGAGGGSIGPTQGEGTSATAAGATPCVCRGGRRSKHCLT